MAKAIHAAFGDHDAPMLFTVALATWPGTSCGRS
jgi:hypothetical protein